MGVVDGSSLPSSTASRRKPIETDSPENGSGTGWTSRGTSSAKGIRTAVVMIAWRASM
jgi:hypothetical protein